MSEFRVVEAMLTTKSRSPSSYCILSSRVAQRVSSGFPFGVIFESENMPTTTHRQKKFSNNHDETMLMGNPCDIAPWTVYNPTWGTRDWETRGAIDNLPHLSPAINRFFSSLSLKVDFDEIAASRSFSSDEEVLRIFWVASFQAIGLSKKPRASSLRKPMSTRTFTNSVNPLYLRVYCPKHSAFVRRIFTTLGAD